SFITIPDEGNAIAVDSSGNAYVAGRVPSGFMYEPGKTGAYQTSFGGGTDGFVTKLNSTATARTYSTYLGGGGADGGLGLGLDSSGNAYVTGDTSGSFPLMGAFQGTFGGGNYDAFVSKLNSSGSALTYSSYLGGGGISTTDTDTGKGIAVDSSGNAYVTGLTS